MTQVNCALCAEPLDGPGHKIAVLSAPPGGTKPRPIYRTRELCEACANPSSQGQLIRVLQRLAGIGEAE